MTTGIVLVDRDDMSREGLVSLIEREPEFEVLAVAEDGRDDLRRALAHKPDVCIIDAETPDVDAAQATREILRRRPGTAVLVLSNRKDGRLIAEALGASALGYVLKHARFADLAAAIHDVSRGRTHLDPECAGMIARDYVARLDPSHNGSSNGGPLSARQREVLRLIAAGRSTTEIARHLHLSVKTIETHRRQVMTRLDAHSVAEAVKYAIREGLTSLDD